MSVHLGHDEPDCYLRQIVPASAIYLTAIKLQIYILQQISGQPLVTRASNEEFTTITEKAPT